MESGKVIAAVRDELSFEEACKSKAKIIFDLAPSIENIESRVMLCAKYNKTLFIHIDLAEGIGKDKAGLRYISDCGVDGIISTRTSLIKSANEVGLKTVQRTFLLDSQSVETAVSMLKTKPDMLEIMPGVISPRVISTICSKVSIPVIAGGLIETVAEAETAIAAGAVAVSIGKKELWNY